MESKDRDCPYKTSANSKTQELEAWQIGHDCRNGSSCLRYFFTLHLAHFTVATYSFLSEISSFTDIDRFSKNREVQTRHHDPPTCAHLSYRVTLKVNWLFREVIISTVYE